MALSPLLWQMNTAQAAADPRRIVALSGCRLLLLALGITPYGVATPNYKLG